MKTGSASHSSEELMENSKGAVSIEKQIDIPSEELTFLFESAGKGLILSSITYVI